MTTDDDDDDQKFHWSLTFGAKSDDAEKCCTYRSSDRLESAREARAQAAAFYEKYLEDERANNGDVLREDYSGYVAIFKVVGGYRSDEFLQKYVIESYFLK
jgi:hypothetical protein